MARIIMMDTAGGCDVLVDVIVLLVSLCVTSSPRVNRVKQHGSSVVFVCFERCHSVVRPFAVGVGVAPLFFTPPTVPACMVAFYCL